MNKATRYERNWTRGYDENETPDEGLIAPISRPTTQEETGLEPWRQVEKAAGQLRLSRANKRKKQGKTRLFAATDGLLLARAEPLCMASHTSLRTVHPLSAITGPMLSS